MNCKSYAGADVKFTGEIGRVTRVVFLPEGSRGGWEISGYGQTVWAHPQNNVGEYAMKAYQEYVKACVAENLDAFGPAMWAAHECPRGPLG